MTFKLILTRPKAQSEQFCHAVQQVLGDKIPALISPLMEIVPLPITGTYDNVSGVIFTSPNGVAQAQRLVLRSGVIAWCVGDSTAQRAKAAGFDIRTSTGFGSDLVQMIRNSHPSGILLHVRGTHAQVPVAAELRKAGVPCEEVVTYDQRGQAPSLALQDALSGDSSLLVPLFSARSARLLRESGPVKAPLHLVTISALVAQAADVLPAKTVTLADMPNFDAMVDATCRVARALITAESA